MLTRLLLVLFLLVTHHASLITSAHATDYDVVNEDIWPSQNDVAQTPGNGKKLLENQWANLGTTFTNNNYSLSGLTVPGSSGTLNISVASGTAYLAGRWISIPASTTITAAASNTNYVFLKFVRDGSNLATGAKFEVNTTGTAPADSTPIAILTAGVASISATTDKRILPTTIEVLTSGTTWTFPAGITRVYVEVYGASGGGGGGGSSSDSVGPNNGSSGGTGGNGGSTNFGALTTNGGSGGSGGTGGGLGGSGSSTADATASGGAVNLTGKGMAGGAAGMGGIGTTSAVVVGMAGSRGGNGGYSAGYVTGSVGSTVSYAIGAAGSAGSAGGSVGGSSVAGSAGQAGQAGRISIHY